MNGHVRLHSGLHIGSGRGGEVSGSDLPVLRDIQAKPFIPGSSFKGVLRSNAEAFLRAFPHPNGKVLACDVTDDEARCISAKRKREIIRREGSYKGRDPDEVLWEESCWVCQLFGSPWLASRVSVLDMPVRGFLPSEWVTTRDGVVIDRETETAAHGKKYDFEVVPTETSFSMEILIENPEDYQMGLVVLGLDFFNQGLALLGGNTSRGLGRIEVELDSLREDTKDTVLASLRPTSQGGAERVEEQHPSGVPASADKQQIEKKKRLWLGALWNKLPKPAEKGV